ncbi:MAG: diacylglycerol kinase [Oscillospiraceae bacterium]|jgi:diacylglycerol kinase|nr:diacylglycerol kinase [Oscillospiraceae bacterium]
MKSFQYAFRGIWHAVKMERNMRAHLAAVYYIIIVGILFEFYEWDWALTALACGLVIGAELINTALERLCDGLKPGHSPVIKAVKDLAAGAVLVCAVAAVCVAAAVLWGQRDLLVFWWESPWDLMESPLFWAGVIALPFWVWFIVWFGKKKKKG